MKGKECEWIQRDLKGMRLKENEKKKETKETTNVLSVRKVLKPDELIAHVLKFNKCGVPNIGGSLWKPYDWKLYPPRSRVYSQPAPVMPQTQKQQTERMSVHHARIHFNQEYFVGILSLIVCIIRFITHWFEKMQRGEAENQNLPLNKTAAQIKLIKDKQRKLIQEGKEHLAIIPPKPKRNETEDDEIQKIYGTNNWDFQFQPIDDRSLEEQTTQKLMETAYHVFVRFFFAFSIHITF